MEENYEAKSIVTMADYWQRTQSQKRAAEALKNLPKYLRKHRVNIKGLDLSNPHTLLMVIPHFLTDHVYRMKMEVGYAWNRDPLVCEMADLVNETMVTIMKLTVSLENVYYPKYNRTPNYTGHNNIILTKHGEFIASAVEKPGKLTTSNRLKLTT